MSVASTGMASRVPCATSRRMRSSRWARTARASPACCARWAAPTASKRPARWPKPVDSHARRRHRAAWCCCRPARRASTSSATTPSAAARSRASQASIRRASAPSRDSVSRDGYDPRPSHGERKESALETGSIRVWDLPTRLFHWALVALIALQYASGEFEWLPMEWHYVLGYTTLALVVFRLLWGFAGSDTSRFRGFVRGPRAVARYVASVARNEDRRTPGHNPLGGWSVLLMLAS